MKNFLDDIQAIFKPDGLLAKLIETYEHRSGQLEMAMAVAGTLEGGKLAVEAETGIGKTLAYLIPAALSRQKVVISTNTLNLQEQILSDAIPFIQREIDPELAALCVKGRQNYLCHYRWEQFVVHPQLELFAPGRTRQKIEKWLGTTGTGDRAELPWLEDNSALWREISATTGQCLGSKCPHEKTCFLTELRRKAAAARILIVNHHLLFSDLALRREGYGEVLPRYESVIFDEAHNIENVATGFFGFSCGHLQLLELVNDVKFAAAQLPADKQEKIILAADGLRSSSERFSTLFPEQTGKFPLREFIDACHIWEEEARAVSGRLAGLAGILSLLDSEGDARQGLANRCENLHSKFSSITGLLETDLEDSHIRWYEKRDKNIVLTASPVDIAAELNSALYPEVRSVIFTSGTLTVGGDFTYFLNRLGLDRNTETLSLASPFDYRNRTLLYVPAHNSEDPFPQPNEEDFPQRTQQIIKEILLASEGRALVLFTSLTGMRNTYPYLLENLPYPVFIQGEAPRNILLESFQKQASSVLLAVASFWEGINVPGDSLSCVIIDKLPFEVPSDPVIMARINRIREDGGNPFMDFQLPRAILALRQGVGRLIRTSTDKGLLAVLDVRLFTRRYGRLFLKSLPPSPVTRELGDVYSFFENCEILDLKSE